MAKRFVSLWFQHLATDWMIRRRPELKDMAFVLASPERGRMVVKAVSAQAHQKNIQEGMVVADCRAIHPELQTFDYSSDKAQQLLSALAEWCIRYTPVAAIDLPDGLILDVSGCPHLWGGEKPYLKDLLAKIRGFGYHVRAGMADTIGAAWAISRYGQASSIVQPDKQKQALLSLPPAALRIETDITERLYKLGLYTIASFIDMPPSALRRRFGQQLLLRINQALGQQMELPIPICPIDPYQERLPSLEPIRTAVGIELALQQLIEQLCKRLADEQEGLRSCIFKCYRIDSNIQKISIGTTRPSRNPAHIFKLFENKIVQIEPALGIELFILEAPIVEELTSSQEALWMQRDTSDTKAVAELLDKIAGRIGGDKIIRYLPAEHHWPENSYKSASSLAEKPAIEWRTDLPRPLQLLATPEPIEVTVPIPDYPPMLFRYKGNLHHVKKADGPERIEQEWWLQQGLYRDYYCVEDMSGTRFWLFRLGHYDRDEPKWFLHGFFA